MAHQGGAARYPDTVFTTLTHHIDVAFLHEAYRCTRKDAAPGVDGVTARAYAEHLEEILQALYARMRDGQEGSQRARPRGRYR